MIRAAVEVASETARFTVTVCAESVLRGLEMVEGMFPGSKVGLVFPIEPEAFFVRDPQATAGVTGHAEGGGPAPEGIPAESSAI